ncbi:Cation transport protein chaC [plant metagenome]|uniref:glutathione-specific gamma-glutamylcyclotransferase n=1 Tax=plant metagenome TaxID=1297885 RepID=A0A484U6V6_9ZZZZ
MPVNPSAAPIIVRPHPEIPLWSEAQRLASMNQALAQIQTGQKVWVFGYGSLIWRPDFPYAERRLATLHGHHRALCLWSREHRGTPECPGLVFGLDRGGSCRGVVYRLADEEIAHVFPQLWVREMTTGSYLPRWLNCQTEDGDVRALVFIMNREGPGYISELPLEEQLAIVRRASGGYGPCTDYVLETERALRRAGIQDRRLQTVARALEAQRHDLPEG